ncbi:MAG: AMP-dependent synthetase and ligase [Betaproteobacteria bacterium]|nr:AMP-dependent synthetase and ligase [Betaproteobacteria bacterium]
MIELSLLSGYASGAIFAYRDRKAIRVEQFLRDVAQLATVLPERRHVFNLCSDRYHFVVGFCAALLKRQISLLPPNQTSDLVTQLKKRYADVYCLTDDASPYRNLETFFYPPMKASYPLAPSMPTIPAAQIAALVFTSGSTGQPLPHEKSWRSLVRGAQAEVARLDLHAYAGMAVLGTVPPQHMYGLESSVLMAMQGGFALHAGRPFYPADVLTELASLPRPRCLVTTPVHLRALLSGSDDLPPVELILCATAALTPQLATAAEVRFAAPLYEIYGCTEAGQVATRRTVQTADWQALPGLTLREDKQGTWVRGGHVETEVMLQDVIEIRGDEHFLLHGRSADLVNIAGKRTSLASLNHHLNSISGVHDGAFFMPAERDGVASRLTAFVVAPGLTRDALIAALRERIDPAFMPRPLRLVEALPRNATGKLPREALSALCAASGGSGS